MSTNPPDDHDRLTRLFAEASALPPERRAQFLERACSGDRRLHADLTSLLESSDAAPEFLRTGGMTAAFSGVSAESVPERIGPYRIEERIGDGGMGVVYRATQETPVRRSVAVKLLRRGVASRQTLARFELECQALAMMEHPGIARVYEAGVTAEGRPWFAMEFVDGESITDYCDRRRLDLHSRLELFARVCDAIQHAHQKAIIHRDLKPSNVLVTELDGRGVPKIIDFGIAKAAEPGLTDRSLHTVAGELLCTPEYMSPEQARLHPGNIDTRTDVYGLGLLLYGLVCGGKPFEAKFRDASFHEICRMILEREPELPSARIRSAGEAGAEAARARDTSAKALQRALRGDLDSIVLKALEKDVADRYETAASLADDVRRYLRAESVEARNAGGIYRLVRFVRRNRLPVGLGTASIVVVLAFATFVTVQNRRLTEQRTVAQDRATAAERSREFAFRMVALADENTGTHEKRAVIRQGLAQLEELFVANPDEHLRFALALWDSYYSCMSDDVCEMLLAGLEQTLSRPDNLLPGMVELRWQLLKDLVLAGRLAAAEPWLTILLEQQAAVFGVGSAETARTRLYTGIYHHRREEMEAARRWTSEAHDELRRIHGENHPLTLKAVGVLGAILIEQGRVAEAEEALRSLLARSTEHLGPTEQTTLACSFNLAVALAKQGRVDESFEHLRYATDRGFFMVAFDENGERLLGYRGIAALGSLRPLHSLPEFREAFGEEGYYAAVWHGDNAGWNKDYAEQIRWYETAIERGASPEAIHASQPDALLRSNPELRRFFARYGVPSGVEGSH